MKSIDRVIGELPFVTAGEASEGVSAFIGNDVTVFLENTCTIDMFGSAKYRNYKYGGDDHIAVVHTEHLAKHASIFVTSAIHKSSYTGKFDYGRNFYAKDADELSISLPEKNGEADFEFMASFLADIEKEKIRQLEDYISSTGLKKCVLSKVEQKAIDDFSTIKFAEFDAVDIFHIKNSKSILSRDIVEDSGEVPYLCASSENNGVSSYISYDEKYKDKGNCVFIGGKTFVVSYQENNFYSNDSHNLILYLKDSEKRNKLIQMFLTTCVNKSLGHKYSWGDSISNKKIQNDKISLPIKDGQPNFELMEILISAIQKLAIKNVCLYVERKKQELGNA